MGFEALRADDRTMSPHVLLVLISALIGVELVHLWWIWWTYWQCSECTRPNRACQCEHDRHVMRPPS
jgi:hypothetical protein